MKKALIWFLSIALTSTLYTPVLAEVEEGVAYIYVSSESGKDSNDGSEDYPLRTIEKAIELAQAKKGEKIISLSGGEYRLNETISLTEEDSNLTIKAKEGEQPIVTGSKSISYASAEKINPEAYPQIYHNVADKILTIQK